MPVNRLKAITLTSCLLALYLGAWAQGARKFQLVGVGGTFPLPIYTQWFQQYQQLHPDWEVRYIAAGSGEGIRQLTSGAADFAASDAPMSDEQLAAAKVKILHFPSVLARGCAYLPPSRYRKRQATAESGVPGGDLSRQHQKLE